MNLLEFHSRLSSPTQDRIKNLPQLSLLFHILNGGAINENDLVNITNEGRQFRLEFISEQSADMAEEKIITQIVPGICGAPIYGIMSSKKDKSLLINFVEL